MTEHTYKCNECGGYHQLQPVCTSKIATEIKPVRALSYEEIENIFKEEKQEVINKMQMGKTGNVSLSTTEKTIIKRIVEELNK